MKLDLGCGNRKQEGHIGIDICKDTEADIIYDLTKTPWLIGENGSKLEDKSVDEAFSSHFFEHLTGPQRIDFMEELYRVLKEGAKLTIHIPYWTSMRSIQDPFHQWPPVCETSFLYFNKNWREINKLTYYPITCDFDYTYGYAVENDTTVKSEQYQQFAIKYYVNSVLDLQVVLTRRADGVA